MAELNPKVAFEEMIKSYLDGLTSIEKNKIPELEVRFGTGNNQNMFKSIAKLDSDNVVKQLYNAGFTCDNKDGQHLLRITPDTSHINKYNETKKSKVRLEIVGFDMIQSYCQHGEDLREILKLPQITTSSNPCDFVKFTLKSDAQVMDKYIPPVIFKDFGFNVSYQIERNSDPRSNENDDFLSRWNNLRKTYRYINRVKFCHPNYPINADISIIQASKKSNDGKYISEFTMHDANIFDNEHTFEIELELDNSRMIGYTSKTLLTELRHCIRTVLSGLQQSNYPIGYIEKSYIIDSYLKLVHGTNYNTNRKIETKDFIGPNSMTLQIDNIIPLNSLSSLTNIRKNYSVTDKADGMRALLYISDNGRIYTIDTNMNIMFTGAIIETKDVNGIFQNSLLDGEFIKYNKFDKVINLFAAFDIYYINKAYVGGFDFQSNLDDDLIDISSQKPKTSKYRYNLLKNFIEELKVISIAEGSINTIKIMCKHFAFSSSKVSIFTAAREIHAKVFDDYEKDGLIFTPTNSGVGGSKESLKHKITWQESFKWKPPKFNTIDFLIKIQKDNKGQDAIHNIYVDGSNLQETGKSIIQYKTIELMCGYTKNHDGYLNPMLELLNGITPPVNENAWEYKPVNFYPTNPADESACFCNVVLSDDVLKTEEGEFFEGDTIVEFRYDLDKIGLNNDNAWKWVPIRNRHDKTTELRNAMKDRINGKQSKPNYGNSYKVANSNWTSIHNPITELMITTGENIQTSPTDNGVYYNKTNTNTNTRGLRDFHNLYVKRKLILGCSSLIKGAKKTLIDYAVGKGGDLPKWIDAKISFVFGIDVKRDNIHNQLDGACARYLNEKKRNPNVLTKALFVVGNSELNIRDNSAYETTDNSYEVQISNAVFGVGNNNSTLWKSVSEQFDVAKNGFDISSIQFALHYFFKDLNMVHQFMRNVSECTSLGGYFTGTCYDGKVLFDKLKLKKNKDALGNIVIFTKDKTNKILEITQNYEQTSFTEEEPCLGYKIDVWQESINKTFSEYLVNFKYVLKLMNNYGFDIISNDESKKMNLPNGTGLFDELYNFMNKSKENRSNFGNAENMTTEEKSISFMNRYFIFKKVRNIENTKIIQKVMNEVMDDEQILKQDTTVIPAIKLNKKILINIEKSSREIDKKPVEKPDRPLDVLEESIEGPVAKPIEKIKIRIKVKKQKDVVNTEKPLEIDKKPVEKPDRPLDVLEESIEGPVVKPIEKTKIRIKVKKQKDVVK